jgi:hypothetical protein
MHPLQLRSWIVPGVLLTTIILAIGLFLGRSYLQSERVAYERGAAIAALHFHCRGTFPTASYLTRTFALGDPTTCADVHRMDDDKVRKPDAPSH